MHLYEEQKELLRKLVDAGGSHLWATLSVHETGIGDALRKKGLTRWTAKEGERQLLHITDAGRKALAENSK